MDKVQRIDEVKISKRKSLNGKYICVLLNENDLHKIANIILMEASKYDENINIRVYSSLRQESFYTSDPNVFFSKDIPDEISKVSISFRDSESSISCEVEMGRTILADKGIDISVSGNDFILVTGIFNELDKEIRFRYAPWRWLYFGKGKIFLFSMNLILIISEYSLFDFIINLLVKYRLFEKGDSTYSLMGSIGWGIIAASSALGYTLFEKYFKRLFPVLEFCGRFTDTSAKKKKTLFWLISFILLPIIINLISSILFTLI